jgi:hypothetical protein
MEDGGLFYVRLVDLTAIWYFWEQFSMFILIWYISFCFGMLYQEKSGNPACKDVDFVHGFHYL